jgi:malate dehydrogenase (quinone)
MVVFLSGQWLKCTNLMLQTQSKVYGKASVGAPPMSVPYIDSRMIMEKTVVIWTFAGFSTASKNGSYSDLPYL